jgi:hypothetical protein
MLIHSVLETSEELVGVLMLANVHRRAIVVLESSPEGTRLIPRVAQKDRD